MLEIVLYFAMFFCFFPLCAMEFFLKCLGAWRKESELFSMQCSPELVTLSMEYLPSPQKSSRLYSLVFPKVAFWLLVRTIAVHPFHQFLIQSLQKILQGLPVIPNLGEHLQQAVTTWDFSGSSFGTPLSLLFTGALLDVVNIGGAASLWFWVVSYFRGFQINFFHLYLLQKVTSV